jgi:hypothetical protein
MPTAPADDPRRRLPAVDRLLSDPRVAPLERVYGREHLLVQARRALERLRQRAAGGDDVEGALDGLPAELARALTEELGQPLGRALNGTGVFLHTNLGRAPLPRAVAAELPPAVPLIGFAGAPFTLFCYLVEGHGSKGFVRAKAFLHAEPAAATRLLDALAAMTADYLAAQARAGASALMLFDSWAGLLGPDDFRRFALPGVRRILEALAAQDLPRIYFPNQGATLLEDVATLPVEVVGIDWRLPLGRARAILGSGIAVQGNLDPAALFAPAPELARQIDRVLEEAGPAPGHVFNLGHGIEANTDPAQVARLVDHVHERTANRGRR